MADGRGEIWAELKKWGAGKMYAINAIHQKILKSDETYNVLPVLPRGSLELLVIAEVRQH
jgi:hypothetical protein